MDQNPNPNQQSSNVRITYNEADFAREKPTVGIRFFNINSGEERIADSEALITAFYNSSNLHVNAMGGQDFGWRLAKETIRRIRDVRDNEDLLDRIVTKFRLTEVSEVTDSHILTWLFNEDLRKAGQAEADQQNQFARQYEEDIRSLDEEDLLGDEDDDDQGDAGAGTPAAQLKPAAKKAPAKKTKKATKPRLSSAQKADERRKLANAKRREENLEAGRDINDGIELSEDEKAALGNIAQNAQNTVANPSQNSDNKNNES